MLTSKCVWAYRTQLDNDGCFFAEPGNNIMVLDSETGRYFISPSNEEEKDFMNRIQRSQAEGRNLFFEEWEEFKEKNNVFY